MSTQLGLDDFSARLLSRRQDPETSKAAGRDLVQSWKLSKQQFLAITYLRVHPGTTAWEMAGGDISIRYFLNRRLPELVRKGLARRGESRVCRITGTKQTTWWPREE